ncbi:MAG: DUF6550 family protein [Lachnospiraceae bacterium]
MKKDYNTKKKFTIATLSVVAICLVGGLFYFMSDDENKEVNDSIPDTSVLEETIVVPEIEMDIIIDPSTDLIPDEEIEVETTIISTDDEDDKPLTQYDAVTPTDDSAPEVNENGEEEVKVYEPNASTDPANGTISSDGTKIYMTGFGWVDWNGGGSEVIEAPNAGTGDVIGIMD